MASDRPIIAFAARRVGNATYPLPAAGGTTLVKGRCLMQNDCFEPGDTSNARRRPPDGAPPEERRAWQQERYFGPLGNLCHAFATAGLQANKLHEYWQQCGSDSDALALAATPVQEATAQATFLPMKTIEDDGVAELLAPWRGETVDAWLPRMMDEFDELHEAAHSCVIRNPDRARLDRLPEIFTEMYLAHRHIDNLQCLRASAVTDEQRPIVDTTGDDATAEGQTAAVPKQPPPDEADIDDDLFPDEIDVEERYPHSYWNLPDEAAKELANLIMGALVNVMEIGGLWGRSYAAEVLAASEKRSMSDEEKEVLGAMFKAWIAFQGKQAAIQKGIQGGDAQRAGEAWAKELLDALDNAYPQFNANPIDPSGGAGAARNGLRMELARGKRFVKLADRLYKAYRELAYAYIVPEGKPAGEQVGRPAAPTAATPDKLTQALAALLTIGPNVSKIAKAIGVPRTTLLGWREFRLRCDQVKADGATRRDNIPRGYKSNGDIEAWQSGDGDDGTDDE